MSDGLLKPDPRRIASWCYDLGYMRHSQVSKMIDHDVRHD